MDNDKLCASQNRQMRQCGNIVKRTSEYGDNMSLDGWLPDSSKDFLTHDHTLTGETHKLEIF